MNDPQIPPPGGDLPAIPMSRPCPSQAQRLLAWPIITFTQLLTGARSLWRGCVPEKGPTSAGRSS